MSSSTADNQDQSSHCKRANQSAGQCAHYCRNPTGARSRSAAKRAAVTSAKQAVRIGLGAGVAIYASGAHARVSHWKRIPAVLIATRRFACSPSKLSRKQTAFYVADRLQAVVASASSSKRDAIADRKFTPWRALVGEQTAGVDPEEGVPSEGRTGPTTRAS
jgi:hypothetical protein